MQNIRKSFAILGIALAAGLLSGCSYNRFVSQEEAVKAHGRKSEPASTPATT